MRSKLRLIFSPPPEIGRANTGLTFTDILFGFVISQLFLRLQNWSNLPWHVRWHLIVGAALVLGSWIGFRRSLHRTEFELKFFNLPLLRFLLDQLMVVLYFRVAVLTPLRTLDVPPGELAENTIRLLVYVFVLYAAWDLSGIWMTKATWSDQPGTKRPKYPRVIDREVTDEADLPNWAGLIITIVTTTLLSVLWRFTANAKPTPSNADLFLVLGVILLVAYRTAKEVRTSWKLG
jgi:hypothetical protein